jgi:hypothetical protein
MAVFRDVQARAAGYAWAETIGSNRRYSLPCRCHCAIIKEGKLHLDPLTKEVS